MRRVLACLAVLLILVCPASALTAHFIDVGQGDCALFRFDDGKHMLIDVGPTDAGGRVVSYLRSAGVVSLDVVVLTHPHEDHIGGFNALARAFRVGKVWDSGYEQGSRLQQSIMRTILKEGIRFGTPKAGFKEVIGQAEVEILAPDRRWRGVGANNSGRAFGHHKSSRPFGGGFFVSSRREAFNDTADVRRLSGANEGD